MSEKEKDIREQVEERARAEEEALGPEPREDEITPAFVRECFDLNREGDGLLFAALHRGRFLANKATKDEWFRWAGHYWEMDVLDERYTGVREVADRYREMKKQVMKDIEEAEQEGKGDQMKILEKRRDSIHGRIKSLHDDGADKCIKWAQRDMAGDGLGVRGEEFDRDPWLLAVKNGVIDLRTGAFRDGRPDDLITKAVPHEWKGIDCPAPNWEAFLESTFEGKTDLIEYLARMFGYGITGVTNENKLAILHGEGRNGKSTYVEAVRYVMGDLSKPIQSDILLEQRSARSSSGPSPDIMALKGLRVAFATETDENRRFSTSKVKWLSGGDTLTGRNPHDKYETVFEPTHLLCLLTNHLPHVQGDDYAFWQRVHLIPFNVRFVDDPKAANERPRVKGLPEKLKAEAPGILAWLVRGCIEWQRQGLNPPEIVRSATAEYRHEEDHIAAFLEECCHPLKDCDPNEDREKYSSVFKAFQHWYEEHIGDFKFCRVKKKKFGQLIDKRFRREKRGDMYVYGIFLKSDYNPEFW